MIAQQLDYETPSLFDRAQRYPHKAGFKREGTSKQAAAAINPLAPTLRDRVLKSLLEARGTADELAERLGETVLSTRPRLSELLKLGKIRETDERRRNASGRMAVVWEAVK